MPTRKPTKKKSKSVPLKESKPEKLTSEAIQAFNGQSYPDVGNVTVTKVHDDTYVSYVSPYYAYTFRLAKPELGKLIRALVIHL